MGMIPYNKWRHDLLAAVSTLDNAIKLLEAGDAADPELKTATIDSMRRIRTKLDQQYLELYRLQKTKKLDD